MLCSPGSSAAKNKKTLDPSLAHQQLAAPVRIRSRSSGRVAYRQSGSVKIISRLSLESVSRMTDLPPDLCTAAVMERRTLHSIRPNQTKLSLIRGGGRASGESSGQPSGTAHRRICCVGFHFAKLGAHAIPAIRRPSVLPSFLPPSGSLSPASDTL